ncbi:MAG: hypothetical protein GYA60_04270 [Candidatus Methanofastidiosa archaeon]|nr:hypothetical protein [Candidatus Methanofastidiosa archaeon]
MLIITKYFLIKIYSLLTILIILNGQSNESDLFDGAIIRLEKEYGIDTKYTEEYYY